MGFLRLSQDIEATARIARNGNIYSIIVEYEVQCNAIQSLEFAGGRTRSSSIACCRANLRQSTYALPLLKQSFGFAQAGGWGGIRTPETLAGLPVFKTGAFNRSATHPVTAHCPEPRV